MRIAVLVAFTLLISIGAAWGQLPGWVISPMPDYYPEYSGDPRACVVQGRMMPEDSPPCALVCSSGSRDPDQRARERLQGICDSLGPGSRTVIGDGECYLIRGTEPDSQYQPVHFEGHPRCAKMSGDPHVTSLDGVRFDLQETGEFVGIKALDDDLEVQYRLEASTDSASVSFTTAVAARVGPHRVMLAARTGTPLRIDGEAIDLPERTVLQFTDDERLGIVRQGNRYTVIWADGSNLHVDFFGKYVSAYFLAPEARDGRLAGLFGDGDGDPANDFHTRDGTLLASPPDFDTLYDLFAESWRTDPEASLFDYAEGESAETFHRPGVPAGRASLENLDPAQRAQAEATCRAAGILEAEALQECVIDVGFSGDESFIASAQAQQTPVLMLGDVFDTWSHRSTFFPLGAASFADRVVSWNPGNPAPDPDTTVADRALGAPDYNTDRKASYLSLGQGGSLIVEFTDNVLIDVPGPDLLIFEVGEPERSTVAISEDGENWVEVGEADSLEALDIAPVATPGARYRYVRLTEIHEREPSSPARIAANAGPDIDAIGAIGAERP